MASLPRSCLVNAIWRGTVLYWTELWIF